MQLEEYQAELVVDCKCELGEGPIWNKSNGLLYWLDITGKRLHQWSPASAEHRVALLPQQIGCMALKGENEAIFAGEQGFQMYHLTTGEMKPLIDPEPHLPSTRFNDGKCDIRGRFLAGTMSNANLPEGALYVMHPDGKVDTLLDQVACSNGIAWSPGFDTLYYVDSLTYRVDAFDYQADTGQISNRRPIISYEPGGALPDGMTWDEQGMLWIAEWGGWKVSRWNPHTGERLAIIHVPAQHVTSCVFGGEEMNVLYITTARNGRSAEELSDQPHAGGLFRVQTSVKGAPCYTFQGKA